MYALASKNCCYFIFNFHCESKPLLLILFAWMISQHFEFRSVAFFSFNHKKPFCCCFEFVVCWGSATKLNTRKLQNRKEITNRMPPSQHNDNSFIHSFTSLRITFLILNQWFIGFRLALTPPKHICANIVHKKTLYSSTNAKQFSVSDVSDS